MAQSRVKHAEVTDTLYADNRATTLAHGRRGQTSSLCCIDAVTPEILQCQGCSIYFSCNVNWLRLQVGPKRCRSRQFWPTLTHSRLLAAVVVSAVLCAFRVSTILPPQWGPRWLVAVRGSNGAI